MRDATVLLTPYLRRMLRTAGRRLSDVLFIIGKHYTPLAVIVLGITGSMAIYMFCRACRYGRFDWWNWKRRAAAKIIRYWLALVAVKLLLKGALR